MTEEDLKKIKEEEEKMNPYELLIRDSIMIWHPYDEEHNKEPETK
jgi:phosphoribosylformylglycinamidine (FGAM) synthase-like enzyme